MSEQLKLAAEERTQAGKGASRAMRRDGRVPAVIYGDKKEPTPIHVEEKALVKMLQTGHFMNSIVMVEVDGKASRTLPKDVQFHPVTDRPLHVDFLRIAANATITVGIPVRFINDEEAPGIKRGGVLNIVRHELELVCDASKLPDEVVIDLTGLEIGDSIHISAVTLPEGTKSAIDDRDFTIATVVAPSAVKSEAAEEAEAAEAAAAAEGEDGAEGEGEAAAEGEGEAGEASEG